MVDTADPPISLHGAIRGLTITMLSRHIAFSFFALLIWDMLLTLKDEVRWPCLLRHVY
jgi:hypothetical protein